MIRINLLPIRQLKERRKAVGELILLALAFLCLLVFLAVAAFWQSNRIKNREAELARLNSEIAAQQKVLAEIKKLEEETAIVNKKIGIVNKLKSESSLAVRVLDEVAKKVDSKRMWLESLDLQGSSLKIKGMALDNRTIASFMDALKASEYIKSVTLENSSMKSYAERNLKSFSLVCTVGVPGGEQEVLNEEQKQKTDSK